jgi:hypothetical protein
LSITPVTILDEDRPIGTHIFTAVERTNGERSIRWSVVSLDGGRSPDGMVGPQGRARGSHDRDIEPMATDPGRAKAALDRIVIPQDALDRIAAMGPRSSLIVTDEGLNSETGKGTDFMVLLSGEPQGGIKTRQRGPAADFSYARPRGQPYWRSPVAGAFTAW